MQIIADIAQNFCQILIGNIRVYYFVLCRFNNFQKRRFEFIL